MSDSTGLLASFLGSLQAALSVLLTLSYGVAAAQFGLITKESSKSVSKLCVRLFLPALLIHDVGSQLDSGTVMRYVPILVWSLLYAFTSLALGKLASKCFKLPAWVVPAIAFNNTTSLPLLLIKSLDSAGILKMLIGSDDSDAIGRAKSYFLVNAIVSNCLTFALGPKFLETEDGSGEDGDNKNDEDEEESQDQNGDVEQANGNDEDADETTSLLPEFVSRQESRLAATTIPRSKRIWHSLPPWSQETLSTLSEFLNAPFFGAVIGAILGLIPPLHKAFFADPDQGGIFKAWLTVSIQNIGDLFASLQIVVVGVNFASSLRKAKRGENSGEVPWLPSLFVLFIRFILWPALSIAIIWAFASRTEILGSDPMLWFAMMLMPTGPPALSLGAMCELTGATEMEKMSIAKFLVLAYLCSPLICFTVVGSLKVSEAVLAAKA